MTAAEQIPSNTVGQNEPEFVPEFLPLDADAPAPPRRCPFWTTLLIHGLRPRRAPHLAAGSFLRAAAANLLSCLAVMLLFAVAYMVPSGESATGSDALRLQIANLVIDAMKVADRGSSFGDHMAFVLVILPILFPFVAICVGILLAPAAARGDSFRSAGGRSVKTALWAAAVLPWILAACIGLIVLHDQVDPPDIFANHRELTDRIGAYPWISLFVGAVFLWMIVRVFRAGLYRYVGPAVGPGLEPRRPKCEDCGYFIGGLPRGSRCPECGLDVGISLPGGRRAEFGETASRIALLRPHAYVRYIRIMLKHVDAMLRLPVYDLRLARRTWWIGFVYSVTAATALLFWGMLQEGWHEVGAPVGAAIVGLCMILASPIVQAIITYIVCMIGRIRHGVADPRASVSVSLFAGAMLWPIAIFVNLQTICMFMPFIRDGFIKIQRFELEYIFLPYFVTAGFAIYFMVVAFGHVSKGLRAAAYANS